MAKIKPHPAPTAAHWWVIQQHDQFEVIQAAGRPALEQVKGERRKAALGPFTSQSEAQERADRLYGRTIVGRRALRGE